MKVLDLQCEQQHVFEGWFSSEADFQSQRDQSLIACPLCGNANISKRLSAPRLNFGAGAQTGSDSPSVTTPTTPSLQEAWLAVAKHILENTVDVGSEFSKEVRKIHYGEAPERAIRGSASQAETESLREEGIHVVAVVLPHMHKHTLQ